MKALKYLIVLAILAGAAWLGWRQLNPAEDPAAAARITAEVTRGDVEESVLASGILKPSRLVAVGAQASGRITSVEVALGEKVAEGQLIAEIDSVTQENDLRTARAALDAVRAQKQERLATLALNEADLARQESMLARRAVSQADYDAAKSQLEVTRAQIQALDAQISESEVAVETAEANLGYTRITAPIDGTVLAIVNQEGQTVNAVQSAPTIVVLGQLDVMTVRTEISEVDVVDVSAGQEVWFTVLGDPQRRYEAALEAIEPAPESITSDSAISSTASSASSATESAIYYNGVFSVPNPEGRLRTYMTAEVHIILGRAEDALTLPASALGARDADGRHAVQVLGADGQVETRRVTVGVNDKVTAQILDGLQEGEQVVIAAAPGAASESRGRRGPFGF